jgi:hypothetical protein
MIRFEDPTPENPFGKLIAEITEDINNKYQSPFRFECINSVDGQTKWLSENMLLGWWSSFVEPCNIVAQIVDSNNTILERWVWETKDHGDLCHKIFLEWSIKNPHSKGIAIGTHDGTTGEWVYPLLNNLIEGYLVEASDTQYENLVVNYKLKENAHPLKKLITSDGLDREFFESPEGFTNSIIKEHTLKFTENITSEVKKTQSLNDLIIECGLKDDLKWLHLDVEGIDDELILSLDDSKIKFPEIIIFENLNLTDDRKKSVIDFLKNKKYYCIDSGWNTVAILNKLDLSLLVHTCDGYEEFWPGMFYTLDFYWDYNQIPVYFSNEEKKISEIVLDCKGSVYKPDKRITQVLTSKTSREGFSDRFIKSIEQIPSKWIIYIQEDMWLKRPLDFRLMTNLIEFANTHNADAIKIHAKLFYWEKYRLEPTNFSIDNQKILKYSEGDNFLLTHAATIWNKDYILKYQKNGEDPWKNEVEGSKRMSSDSHNHYHYNIHWHCQPGVSESGNKSREFFVYAPVVDEMKSMELKMR